jgi:hypothetical protein
MDYKHTTIKTSPNVSCADITYLGQCLRYLIDTTFRESALHLSSGDLVVILTYFSHYLKLETTSGDF